MDLTIRFGLVLMIVPVLSTATIQPAPSFFEPGCHDAPAGFAAQAFLPTDPAEPPRERWQPGDGAWLTGSDQEVAMERTSDGGAVLLELVVLATGRVGNVRVICSPDPWFARKAYDHVRQTYFHPGRLNGLDVDMLTEAELTFQRFPFGFYTQSRFWPGDRISSWTFGRTLPPQPPPTEWESGPQYGSGPSPGAYDVEPRLVYEPPEPPYPEEARRRKVTGEVVLRVRITVDGTTEVLGIIEAGCQPCIEAARAHALRYRWKPALKDGTPVEATGVISVTFGLFPTGPGSYDQPPALARRVTPEYSDEARDQKIEGEVALEVVILKTGRVGYVRVLRSLDPGLYAQAMAAVRRRTFRPARLRGEAVAALVEIEVEFRLL